MYIASRDFKPHGRIWFLMALPDVSLCFLVQLADNRGFTTLPCLTISAVMKFSSCYLLSDLLSAIKDARMSLTWHGIFICAS